MEHLSELRAARSGLDEKVTIHVWVPYHVVGLVVGPKGATVKRIQQVTQTYIVTPSRDKDPFFEVKGTSTNVLRARREIESYIALRTNLDSCDDLRNGNLKNTSGSIEENVFSHFHKSHHPQHYERLFGDNPTSTSTSKFPGFKGTLSNLGDSCECMSASLLSTSKSSPVFQFPGRVSALINDSYPLVLEGNSSDIANSLSSGTSAREECRCGWKSMVFSGIKFSPPSSSYLSMSAPLLAPENSFSSLRSASQPISPTGSYESSSSDGLSTVSPKLSPFRVKQKNAAAAASLTSCYYCMMTEDLKEVAALIPCRHRFCQNCAHYIASTLGSCPLCNTQVTNVMHL